MLEELKSTNSVIIICSVIAVILLICYILLRYRSTESFSYVPAEAYELDVQLAQKYLGDRISEIYTILKKFYGDDFLMSPTSEAFNDSILPQARNDIINFINSWKNRMTSKYSESIRNSAKYAIDYQYDNNVLYVIITMNNRKDTYYV